MTPPNELPLFAHATRATKIEGILADITLSSPVAEVIKPSSALRVDALDVPFEAQTELTSDAPVMPPEGCAIEVAGIVAGTTLPELVHEFTAPVTEPCVEMSGVSVETRAELSSDILEAQVECGAIDTDGIVAAPVLPVLAAELTEPVVGLRKKALKASIQTPFGSISNAAEDCAESRTGQPDGVARQPPTLLPIRPIHERPATLAAALAEIRASGALEANALRHVLSDAAMVAKVTGKPLEHLPCSPVALRPILKAIRAARHNLTVSRWSTIKSSVARALKITGWIDHDGESVVALTQAWQRGADQIPQPGQRASFVGFARFCVARDIQPEAVTLTTIDEYGIWRSERTLTLDITHVASAVRRVWRHLQQTYAEWPQSHIPAARDPRQISLLPESFPLCFVAEVGQVINDLKTIKPLDPRFKKRYSDYTIANTRHTIFRAATVVAAAVGGADKIMTLRDVVAPEPLRTVMNEHFARVGGDEGWAPSAKTTVVTLKRVAVVCGSISEDELKEISAIVQLINPAAGNLSKKARDRVAQFFDPDMLAALARLPEKLFQDADKLQDAGLHDRAGRTYARALQLAIVLVNPLRRRSLAELNLDRHFTRDKSGRIYRLYIRAGEIKNAATIESLIPPELSKRLETYLREYRQIFQNASSALLFPGGNEGHVSPCTIARNVKELVERELGADFNIHCVRHLTATLLLEDDPRNMVLAQQLLGHRDPKTTERIYGHARIHAAQKAWGVTLERRIAEATKIKTKGTNATTDCKSKAASVDKTVKKPKTGKTQHKKKAAPSAIKGQSEPNTQAADVDSAPVAAEQLGATDE